MIRIGIVGSDNSHAMVFSKLINNKNEKTGEYLFPGCKVVSLFGLDQTRNEEVAKEGNIGNIVKTPEEMIGNVDAVMVVFRHGDLHFKYAAPFVEAGISTWVDKPFTINSEQAVKLVEMAEKNNTLISGGSTVKHVPEIIELKQRIHQNKEIGEVNSAAVSFRSYLNSKYGGIFFYCLHVTETVMSMFGYDPQSVWAQTNKGNVTAIAEYEDYQITLNFFDKIPEFHIIAYGNEGIIEKYIDLSVDYEFGLRSFIGALKKGKSDVSYEQLYKPIIFTNAMIKSMKTGKRVILDTDV